LYNNYNIFYSKNYGDLTNHPEVRSGKQSVVHSYISSFSKDGNFSTLKEAIKQPSRKIKIMESNNPVQLNRREVSKYKPRLESPLRHIHTVKHITRLSVEER